VTESQATESNREAAANKRAPRTHWVVAAIFVILASLGVVVSLVGWWVRSTLFETDAFMEVVESSLSSEEVVTLLGDAISEQVVTALDVEGRLEEGLGAVDTYLSESLVEALDLSTSAAAMLGRLDVFRLSDLAVPIAAPINQTIEDGVDDLVRSDAFQQTLPDAVAFAHQAVVALIREDTESLENVSVVDGEVRWYILPLVEGAITYLFADSALPPVVEPVQVPEATYEEPRTDAIAALGDALGTLLPEDFGQVTIMSADTLEGWQSLVRTLDRAVYAAILATLILGAAAFAISPNRRRTLVQVTFGSVVAVLIAWIVQRNVVAAVDAAIRGQSQQAAVDVLFDAVFASLRNVSRTYMLVAGVVGISAHVAGRPRWLQALRTLGRSDQEGETQTSNFEEMIAGHRDASVVVGVLIAVGILWWVGISLASVVIVGAGLGWYLWYLGRVGERSAVEATPG
jgi:hypothetical protein